MIVQICGFCHGSGMQAPTIDRCQVCQGSGYPPGYTPPTSAEVSRWLKTGQVAAQHGKMVIPPQ